MNRTFIVLFVISACASADTPLDRLARWTGLIPDPSSATCALVNCSFTSCRGSQRCARGMHCDPSNRTCGANLTSVGGGCVASSDCAGSFSGAHCDSSGKCARPRAEGESCSSLGDCPFPLTCGAASTCTLGNHSRGSGAACNEASGALCRLSLSCSTSSGDCEPLPAAAGDNCTAARGCQLPMMCSSSGVCVGLQSLGVGEKCATSIHCKPGLVCGRSSGICRNLTAEAAGSASEMWSECASDAACPDELRCECDASSGKRICVPVPASTSDAAKKFASLADCALLDPDNAIAGCEPQYFDFIRSINSTIIDAICGRPAPAPIPVPINQALFIVPVAVVGLILVLVLIVKIGGSPKTATS